VRAVHEDELKAISEMKTEEEVEGRIRFLIEKQQEYRLREQITRSKLAKVRRDAEESIVFNSHTEPIVKVKKGGKSKWTKAVESFMEIMKSSIPDLTFEQAEKMLSKSSKVE
jgi:hypothetical protein